MATNESGNPSASNETPSRQCVLLQLYIKDVSFEAPAVPGVLFGHEQPAVEFDLSNTYSLSLEASAKLGEVYAVTVQVTVRAHAADKTLFLIEVQQGGLFEVSGYPQEEQDFILRTKAPEMLYPYARELVSSLVSRAGFPRLQLRPLNFESRYAGAMQEYHDSVQKAASPA